MPQERAGLFLLDGGDIALIERQLRSHHYWMFPGGGIDAGESPEQAAAREAKEELGLDVVVGRRVLELHDWWFGREVQHFFLATAAGRELSAMSGPEVAAMSATNTYRSAWVPVEEVAALDVLPAAAKEMVVAAAQTGEWPAEPSVVHSDEVFPPEDRELSPDERRT